VAVGQRERLERVCRYALRPPVAIERLTVTDDDQVRVSLKRPWRDGTTALVFDPAAFLGRLAVLVPRPSINLLLYHGVLGARSGVARGGRASRDPGDGACHGATESDDEDVHRDLRAKRGDRRARDLCWAALMQRTFGFDVLVCPRCGGRVQLIAIIEPEAVLDRILRHVGAPTQVPPPRPARTPPPAAEDSIDTAGDVDVADSAPCG
jgi:hypothetical protein